MAFYHKTTGRYLVGEQGSVTLLCSSDNNRTKIMITFYNVIDNYDDILSFARTMEIVDGSSKVSKNEKYSRITIRGPGSFIFGDLELNDRLFEFFYRTNARPVLEQTTL